MGRAKPKVEGPTSKVTAKNQISVPPEVREKLGIGPGSTVKWEERDGEIVVRRVGKYTSLDIHHALFGDRPPPRRTLEELKAAVGDYLDEKHRHGRR